MKTGQDGQSRGFEENFTTSEERKLLYTKRATSTAAGKLERLPSQH
jgi:hypothetical protein